MAFARPNKANLSKLGLSFPKIIFPAIALEIQETRTNKSKEKKSWFSIMKREKETS